VAALRVLWQLAVASSRRTRDRATVGSPSSSAPRVRNSNIAHFCPRIDAQNGARSAEFSRLDRQPAARGFWQNQPLVRKREAS
jgi:hypothetical protein